jgi:hypothetical protein
VRARAALVGFLVFALAACSDRGGPPPGSAPPSPTASPPAQAPTPLPSTASPTDSPPAASPGSQPADVPVATLVVGDERYPGEVGGYTFGRITSSAPWLPAFALDQVTVPSGARLSVELDDRAAIARWVARYAAAGDTGAFVITGLAEAASPTAEFRAPPPGDWVLSVVLTYGGGAGNGAYYWHVLVE